MCTNSWTTVFSCHVVRDHCRAALCTSTLPIPSASPITVSDITVQLLNASLLILPRIRHTVVYIFSYLVKVLYSQSRFFCFKRTSVYKLNKLLSVRGSLLSCSVMLLLTNCTSCTMFSVPNKWWWWWSIYVIKHASVSGNPWETLPQFIDPITSSDYLLVSGSAASKSVVTLWCTLGFTGSVAKVGKSPMLL